MRLSWFCRLSGSLLATCSHGSGALGEGVTQHLRRLLSLREMLREPFHSRAKQALLRDWRVEEGHLFSVPDLKQIQPEFKVQR